MGYRGQIASDEEVQQAGMEGLYGAINGAARWGFYSAIAGLAAYRFSPVYRNLTFQFKVYLQMSGMTIGSIIEADRRLRDFEVKSRRMRKLRRDQETWQRYEDDYQRANLAQKNIVKPKDATVKNETAGKVEMADVVNVVDVAKEK